VLGTTEAVGTDYVSAADLDIAAVDIVSAPAADQGRMVAQIELGRGPRVD
jgi:hypothetical protein